MRAKRQKKLCFFRPSGSLRGFKKTVLDQQFQELEQKFKNLEQKFKELEQKVNQNVSENVSENNSLKENEWSIEEYKNSILIRYYIDPNFRKFLKDLGAKWLVLKKAWMFPKSKSDEIIEKIKIDFSTWIFIDLR